MNNEPTMESPKQVTIGRLNELKISDDMEKRLKTTQDVLDHFQTAYDFLSTLDSEQAKIVARLIKSLIDEGDINNPVNTLNHSIDDIIDDLNR